MDRYGELILSWSVGYKGTQLHFITDDVLVYSCGNAITLIRSNGGHVRSIQSEGSGVTALTVCQKTGFVAYAETTLKPDIFIIKYPMCLLQYTLKGGASLEFKHLAFSNDGKKLVSLAGIPDFKMTIWNISESDGVEICSVSVGDGATGVSINPLNWKQIVLFGPSRITLWNMEHCGKEKLLTPVEAELPEKSAEVGSKTVSNFAITDNDIQATGVGTNIPPNMSEVLYKESYEDFIRPRELMEVKSFCWTPKQSIYVGCAGGQLMMVDVDTGCTTVLVNPQPPMKRSDAYDSEESLSSTSSDTVKTAHALLKEGSTDCLVLSRRGLFATGKSGLVQCFDVKNLRLLDEVTISQPAMQLSCSPTYSKLAVGAESGTILIMDSQNFSSTLKPVSNNLHTEFIGVDVLCPGSEHCVTCRSDGTVQVWDVQNGGLITSLDLDTECTSVACPLSCKLAVVGAASGHLYMISLVKLTSATLVERRLMHDGPVNTIKHDQAGLFMISASTDGLVFFYSSKPSTKFDVLGYIELAGSILDISLLSVSDSSSTGKTQAGFLTNKAKGHREVTHFKLENSILEQKSPELYADASKMFSRDFLECSSALMDDMCTLTLIPEDKALSLLDKTMQLAQFSLDFPQVDQELFPIKSLHYEGHDMNSGKVVLSFHQKWSASVASDGKLLLRLTGNPESFLSCTPHHYQTKGCQGVTFTSDSQSLITIGDSGTITCWKMKYSDYGNKKGLAAIEHFNNTMASMDDQHTMENQILEEMHELLEQDTTRSPSPEKNWFALSKDEACKEEDEKYSETKTELLKEICALREKVLKMISTNEDLPDIEKLGRQEFILDTDDYQRMLLEEEKQIGSVREEIELSNLAAMFLTDQIKRECWNKMKVKGKTIKGFQARIEVSNYPLMARSETTLKELEKVLGLRRIELAEQKIRKEATVELKKTLQPLRHDDLLEEDDLLGEVKERQAQQKEEEEEEESDPIALLGSQRDCYGGHCDYLTDQFNLHSQVYKKHQITLLQNCIFMVKEHFNKEFDDIMRMKVNEIARIKEKNVRIFKIISQLKLDEPLVQPSLSVLEEPEKLLVVGDSEVNVEKYVSPEEEKKIEEAEKLEEKKRLAAMGDNPRERALDMMMGGRLEANVEEDLFKDIPRPEFMLKDPAEMSEEEIRMAREFDKKEEAFLEEREKLKKALEAELRKLQASIVQGMEQFDERLQKLFQLKIRTRMATHHDELNMFHLTRSLFVEREVVMKIQQHNDLLHEKKIAKIQLGASISEARAKVEGVREQYELLATEDKEMDKAFRKDFSDCEPYVDQLYKLFRRRPRGQKLKASVDPILGDPLSQDLFAMRPSSSGTMRDGDNPMGELDHVSHMPEGLEPFSWERFVIHRHKKLESEAKVKALALELAEMSAFLQRRQNEESRVQQEIQNNFKEISRLQEDKVVFDLNLEIQLLLKQGQVELDTDDFMPDFSGSVLVHRSKIEDLNSQIRMMGEAKLNSMLECKDFKRGIHMLEWERHKMEMEEGGLLDKAKDIQMMRVTRDLLQRLHEKDLFSKDIREKETLEHTIEFNKRTLTRVLHEKSKALKDISKQVKAKITENKELDKKLRELQVSVAERDQIEKLADVAPSEANREQRMKEIVVRRKLVETIKAQDEEFSLLKLEVERLRMKTFPALVQVD